jgi:hypothetical protein
MPLPSPPGRRLTSNQHRAAALIVGFIVGVSLLVGCGASSTTSTTSDTVSPAVPATGASAVPDVLNFTATGLDGTAINGATFVGRPVAFWFWAPH